MPRPLLRHAQPNWTLLLAAAVVGTLACSLTQPAAPETSAGGAGATPGSGGRSAGGSNGSGGASAGTGGAGSEGKGGATGGSPAGSGGQAQESVPPDAAAGPVARDSNPPPDTGVDSAVPPSGSACNGTAAPPTQGMRNLVVAGETRKFILRLPAGYDGKKPWPVIFVFHGAGQSAGYFDSNTNLRAELGDKAVLVLPDGPIKPDGRRSWVFRSPDNVVFVDALVNWLGQNLCVDKSRLFATGLSSGGYMSLTLACQRGDVFRAVATASGGMVETDNCRGNPNVWLRLGKADSAGTIDSVTKARDFWLTRKGCMTANPKPIEPAPCVSYAGCQGGTSVVFCADTGGHGWPAYYAKGIWGEFSRP